MFGSHSGNLSNPNRSKAVDCRGEKSRSILLEAAQKHLTRSTYEEKNGNRLHKRLAHDLVKLAVHFRGITTHYFKLRFHLEYRFLASLGRLEHVELKDPLPPTWLVLNGDTWLVLSGSCFPQLGCGRSGFPQSPLLHGLSFTSCK